MNQAILNFQNALVACDDTNKIINKYLLFGTPYVFKDDEDKFFEFKQDISSFFEIEQTQIYVVGSGKLGFSIAPNKRFKLFDAESDIDVAIIDDNLFDKYWEMIYKDRIRKDYYTEEECGQYYIFLEYLFKGWLRPDLFPRKIQTEWFEFFKSLYPKYDYKVAAGIYKNNEFFMEYNRYNIDRIRRDLKNGL